MPKFESVLLAEATRRFPALAAPSFELERRSDDDRVLVHAGALEVDELPLDFRSLDAWAGREEETRDEAAFVGLVVDGDIVVRDYAFNTELDFGPFLYVRGGFRAKNALFSGSHVVVEGDVAVEQTIVGRYNHGSITCKKGVRCEVLYASQHLTIVEGVLAAHVVVSVGNPVRTDKARADVRGFVGGGSSWKAMRLIDSAYRRMDRLDEKAVRGALDKGRSLLRGPPPPVDPSDNSVRGVLLRAGCVEGDEYDDGFRTEDAGERTALWFSTAEEPDGVDRVATVKRYREGLTAAGFTIEQDPNDPDIDFVRR